MDDFELEIKKDFINEAMINLEEVEGSFMELESSHDPKPLLEKIFRMAHNLKGGSRAVGFGNVAEFTHELENLVLKIQKNEVQLSSEMVTTLLRSNDRLIEMFQSLKQDINFTMDNSDLIEDIKSWINGRQAAVIQESIVAKPVEPPSANAFFAGDDLAELMQAAAIKESTQEVVQQDATPAQTPAPTPEPKLEAKMEPKTEPKSGSGNGANSGNGEKEDEIVRVSLSKIDTLNDYVGELIVIQSVIQQQTRSGNITKAIAAIQQMTKLSKDIQSISMGLRMLPVKPLIQKLQRVVRDTAKSLNKDVELLVEGEGLDVDKSVLDRLADPLIHILRNAVDHGLEKSDERLQSSKSKTGHVTLVFQNEGNHLTVEVKDDGKGINHEIIKTKAIEKGLITENQILSEKQLVNLVFHPGFSTKSETSEISGRGVGMDVVKTNIDKIGGQIEISTVVGSGTSFKIQIPLSLAVIDGLVVRNGKSRYAIPLNQVHETINLSEVKVHSGKVGIGSCFELRGSIVPLLTLDSVMGSKESHSEAPKTALLFMVAEQPIAVQISEVVQSQQIVIKPLTNGVKAQKGWIGSCVLGDGLPTLILSPNDMLVGKITSIMDHKTNEMRKSA
jgi:two-component system, chemotaxis family, sensor kinase CheA